MVYSEQKYYDLTQNPESIRSKQLVLVSGRDRYNCDEPGQFPTLRVPISRHYLAKPFLAGYCLAAGWLNGSRRHRPLTVERTLYKRQWARTSESGHTAKSSKLGPRRRPGGRPSRGPSREPGWISRRSRVSRSNIEAKTGEVIESHRYFRGASTTCRGLDTHRQVEDGGNDPRQPQWAGINQSLLTRIDPPKELGNCTIVTIHCRDRPPV